jgi:hypothetical protein
MLAQPPMSAAASAIPAQLFTAKDGFIGFSAA